MPTWIKPLRRKIGVVTLTLACVFAAGWVRSRTICEKAYIPCGTHSLAALMSGDGEFWCGLSTAHESGYFPRSADWVIVPLKQHKTGIASLDWTWSYLRIGIGSRPGNPPQINQSVWASAPYWSIVIPMTLFSEWLCCCRHDHRSSLQNRAESIFRD